ncbi:unnamed protein product [Brachionus calyciflorus]|uniref:Transmembrane protein n=1 Tax=Brachionus calyciflorus TaxID=104777 RepID=A0A813W9I1_9BILA|nr:unnamed protein product [Brachionus calyciflorus]
MKKSSDTNLKSNLQTLKQLFQSSTDLNDKQSEVFISAIYNSIALTVFAVCIGLCFLLFSILQVFIRSILWAILTSAFLFPLKQYLTSLARNQLETIDKTESVLALQLILFPFNLIDSVVNIGFTFIKSKIPQITFLILFITLFNLIYSFNDYFLTYSIYLYLYTKINFLIFINYVDNNWIISTTIILCYFLALVLYWKIEYTLLFQILSLPVWSMILLFVSKLLGEYRPIFMLLFILLTLFGIFSTIKEYLTPQKSDKKKFINMNFLSLNSTIKKNSDIYFVLIFWLFISVKFRYDLYIAIPFGILIWKLIKLITRNILEFLRVNQTLNNLKNWLFIRKDAVTPKPFVLVFNFFLVGDRKFNQILQKSMDSLITTLMIFILIGFLLTSLVVLVFQVHSEGVEFINLSTNILNQSLYSKPELNEWLPEKSYVEKMYQTGMNNVYLYGKDWLMNSFRSTFQEEKNTTSYLVLESQLLQHWDNLYSYLSDKNIKNQTLNETILKRKYWYTWKSKLKDQESFNFKQLFLIIKDNIGILISILDSLYEFLKGNLNILLKIIYKLISIIFASGFALVNFVLSFIVYITASFYLLSMSSDRFKPLIWLSEINFFKMFNKSEILTSAIEESIRSVFVVSLKMALFYGLYTYLINCLFGVSIVYLPAIIAAFFAFLPIFGTYWVAIPGFLELWFIQDSPVMALVFVFMNLLPQLMTVDQAIYSEIKASHPYLTGLSFVGGVYLAGLEGAFIGPIVLCLIIVIGRVFTSFDSSDLKSQKIVRTMSTET